MCTSIIELMKILGEEESVNQIQARAQEEKKQVEKNDLLYIF